MFLKNNLTKIYCQISKLQMNLWIPYTCNVTRLAKVEKMGRMWIYFASWIKINKDMPLQYTITVSLKTFSWWQTRDSCPVTLSVANGYHLF